ncbi:NUDIX domain-containing protein [Cellulosimicrobium marinum]|uniref:NUDIX domain-containing protein n=1 Tax=Cellulosimicrobium marinum TaxID=1638992 RepID=UPI001E3B2DBE|nr:NUDIX domain-containing protein [Cellulosimicrobium marinum]MCB7136205.1 NUDIX domain-containing protein [Cellulosimicrobium marinum]
MRLSAGLVLYRVRGDVVEVLLGHMGGPLWARKDAGAWTIPKGEPDPGEDLHAAALREFEEEMGTPAPDAGRPDLDLGEVRQRAGKVVTAWAREGDVDAATARSTTFALEWPPRSGRLQEFPELDRARWVPLAEARGLVVGGQVALLDRLEESLGRDDGGRDRAGAQPSR